MTTISTCLDRIRAYAHHMGWRKSRLAREAGMSDTVLRDFDKLSWNPTRETIEKLEAIIPSDFHAPTSEAA